MVTIGVIAILAAMVFPQYQKAIRRGHRQAAEDILRTIYAGEQVYESVNGVFLARAAGDDWSVIFMDNPNLAGGPLPVTFAVATPTSTTFTATATYTPTAATMTIDHNNTLTGGW
jgi:Tfp pilus assembly protein PilE